MKVELAPFGIKVATLNPGGFNNGFNDRGVDAMMNWYNPEVNFTPRETFRATYDMLAEQMDLQIMAARQFKSCSPKNTSFVMSYRSTEEWPKQTQKGAWEMMS